MNQKKGDHDDRTLWALMLLSLIVDGLFHFLPRLTGMSELEGLGAVLLGLYVCSRPATNALNLLLYGGRLGGWHSLTRPDAAWLALNFLVLVSGLTLIVSGTTRFFSGTL